MNMINVKFLQDDKEIGFIYSPTMARKNSFYSYVLCDSEGLYNLSVCVENLSSRNINFIFKTNDVDDTSAIETRVAKKETVSFSIPDDCLEFLHNVWVQRMQISVHEIDWPFRTGRAFGVELHVATRAHATNINGISSFNLWS